MNVPSSQVAYRKRIGHVGSKAVIEIGLTGGLKIVGVQSPTGKINTIGAGSHRAIARFLAKKNEPEMIIDELEKTADPRLEDFQDVLPFWEEVLSKIKELHG